MVAKPLALVVKEHLFDAYADVGTTLPLYPRFPSVPFTFSSHSLISHAGSRSSRFHWRSGIWQVVRGQARTVRSPGVLHRSRNLGGSLADERGRLHVRPGNDPTPLKGRGNERDDARINDIPEELTGLATRTGAAQRPATATATATMTGWLKAGRYGRQPHTGGMRGEDNRKPLESAVADHHGAVLTADTEITGAGPA